MSGLYDVCTKLSGCLVNGADRVGAAIGSPAFEPILPYNALESSPDRSRPIDDFDRMLQFVAVNK